MSNEFLDYIEDILDAMEKASILVEGISYDTFASDFRIHFAVAHALHIIGEATKRLPLHIREAYPEIPWRGMAGMRDRIAHGYDRVDLQIVWDVIARDIPQIRPQLEQILQDYASD